MQFGEEQAPSGRMISLTPLIDVVFILLVFFMLASSFLDWRAVDLRLSGAPAASPAAGRSIVIVLQPDEGLSLNGRSVSEEEALAETRKLLADDGERPVILRPEAGVALQRVVRLMDLLKAAGVADIALSRTR